MRLSVAPLLETVRNL